MGVCVYANLGVCVCVCVCAWRSGTGGGEGGLTGEGRGAV